MITTVESLPPPILLYFSKTLLSDFDNLEFEMKKFLRIMKLASKKIDDRHPGKKNELKKLIKLWQEEYERAKIKKEKYEEALKNAEKMPRIPTTGGTMRFKRFQS